MVGHKKSSIPSWLDPFTRLSLSDVAQCERLRRARHYIGLTQAQVSGLFGMSQTQYSRIESGEVAEVYLDARAFCHVFKDYLYFIFKGGDYEDAEGNPSKFRKPRNHLQLHGAKPPRTQKP